MKRESRYLILFRILIYLAGLSGLFSVTSSSHLGCILIPVLSSVLRNGHKDFAWFSVFIHPVSQANRTVGEIEILGIRCYDAWTLSLSLSLSLWPFFQNDPFSRLNQPIRELLKNSARGQVLSIISLVIFHDSSSYKLSVKLWIHTFLILHLP